MVGHTHEDVDQVFSKKGFNQEVDSLSASLYFMLLNEFFFFNLDSVIGLTATWQ